MGINDKKNSVTITLFGDLKATSGVGASAASCAAIARALNDEFKMNHKDEEINSFTFEGEKAYHGAPSGIDNTCAVFGGLIVFERNLKGGENKVERLALKAPVECVLGNTGITSDTSEAVADVTREKETDQKRFARIFHHYEGIVAEGKKAFQEDDLKKVGEMMNENHDLLRQIGVSCKESELLVEIARASGALGAKITGTGRGGLVLALTPGKKLQEEVARSIEEKHFEAMRIRIGKNLLA